MTGKFKASIGPELSAGNKSMPELPEVHLLHVITFTVRSKPPTLSRHRIGGRKGILPSRELHLRGHPVGIPSGNLYPQSTRLARSCSRSSPIR